MDFITSFPGRILDAFMQNPALFLELIVMAVIICLLWFDISKAKNNQFARQVTSRIGKDEQDVIDLADIASKIFAKYEEKIDTELSKANVLFTVKEYLTFMLIGTIVGILLGFVLFPFQGLWKGIFFFIPSEVFKAFFGRILAGALFATAGAFFPKLWLMLLTSKRQKLLSAQIQDSLLNIADALKSGHVIQDAIKIVGQEMPFPIGPEFARAYQEMETGKSLNVALVDLKKRIGLKDFTMAVNAIEIQFEVGGKLEPLLRNMVKIIGERQELKKEIEKTIAQSKMTGIVLLSFPVFFVIVFSMLNKESFATMLNTTIGIILLVVAFICYVIAAWIILWIIKDVSKDE